MHIKISYSTLILFSLIFSSIVGIILQQRLFDFAHTYGNSLKLFLYFTFIINIILIAIYYSALPSIMFLPVGIIFLIPYLLSQEFFLGKIVLIFFYLSASYFYLFKVNTSSIKFLKYPFYFYAGYISFKLLIGYSVNDVFDNSSNWISFYGILLIAPYLFLCVYHRTQVSFFSVGVLLFLSLLSLSRSGIISSSILFLSILIYSFGLKRSILIFSILFISIITIYNLFYFESFSSVDQWRMQNFLSDGGRKSLNYLFIQKFGVENIFLPFDFNYFSRFLGYSNVHNSYINLFGRDFIFGLLITFSFIIFFLSSYCLSLKLILLSCIFRIFTDEGALFGYFDIVFYFPFFLLLSRFTSLKHE